MNPLQQLAARGQSPWLDYLKRSLIRNGELQALIDRDGLKGLTSNPSIFEKAIAESNDYAGAMAQYLKGADHGVSDIYEHLAIADIQAAADILRPVYDQTQRRDGYVSSSVRLIWRTTPKRQSAKRHGYGLPSTAQT